MKKIFKIRIIPFLKTLLTIPIIVLISVLWSLSLLFFVSFGLLFLCFLFLLVGSDKVKDFLGDIEDSLDEISEKLEE